MFIKVLVWSCLGALPLKIARVTCSVVGTATLLTAGTDAAGASAGPMGMPRMSRKCRDGAFPSLRPNKNVRPLVKRCAAFLEIIMPVVGTFDTVEFVSKAALCHFAANAKSSLMRARRASQIVEREVR